MRIGYKIKLIHNQFKNFIDSSEAIKNSTLTRVESLVLGYIYYLNNKVSQKDIQSKFTINRSTCSEIINSLVLQGFLEKIECETDSRVKELKITKKGKSEYLKFIETFENADKSNLKNLSDEEKQQLSNLLDKILEGGNCNGKK